MPLTPTNIRRRKGPVGRHALTTVALALWASGCVPINDPAAWGRYPQGHDAVQAEVDEAADAVRAGNFAIAEAKVQRALYFEPRNPYAMLTAAVLYAETGRPERARQALEDILALPVPVQVIGDVWGMPAATTVQEVAQAKLDALDDQPGRRRDAPFGVVPATPANGSALMDGAKAGEPAAWGESGGSAAMDMDGGRDPAVQRFRILRDLRDQDLVTQEEYLRRREANVGALLPLTERPPATGLERSVSDAPVIADRLRQLRQAYEARYISAAQHAAERGVILDSLLPANPKEREPAPLPPDDAVSIAAAVGRLERLRELGLITAGEMAAERDRLNALMARFAPGQRPAASASASGSLAVERRAPLPPPAPPPAKPEGAKAGAAASSTGGGARGPASGSDGGARREPGSDARALASRPTLLVPDPSGNPAAVLRTGRASDEAVPYQASGQTSGRLGDALPLDGVGSGQTSGAEATASGPVQAVHLASFQSEARAQAGWQALMKRYPVLAGYSSQIVQVSLPGKGVFFRVLVAPLSGSDEAKTLCARLAGQYCHPLMLGR